MPTAPTPLHWPPAWLTDAPTPVTGVAPAEEPTLPTADTAPPVARPVAQPLAQLVSDLRRRGHYFYVSGDGLSVTPGLPADMLVEVKDRKAEVRDYLVSEPPARPCFAANGVPVCAHCAKPFLPNRAEPAICWQCLNIAGWNGIEGPVLPVAGGQPGAPIAGNRAEDPNAEGRVRAVMDALTSKDF